LAFAVNEAAVNGAPRDVDGFSAQLIHDRFGIH
jgi:hypothetical protein